MISHIVFILSFTFIYSLQVTHTFFFCSNIYMWALSLGTQAYCSYNGAIKSRLAVNDSLSSEYKLLLLNKFI